MATLETPPKRGTTAIGVTEKLGVSLAGKAVIVTGGNAGFGLETCRALATTGASVILASRSTENGNAARDDILKTVPEGNVLVLQLDLASLRSIAKFADEFNSKCSDPLVALICNAGLGFQKYAVTEEGWESTVGVCHFGHFALFKRLEDRLKAAGSSRVVMVSSFSHLQGPSFRVGKDKLMSTILLDKGSFGMGHYAYSIAKRCNCLMALEIASKYKDTGISAYSVHPATMVNTSFGKGFLKYLFWLVSPFTQTVEEGAATQTYCALAPGLEVHSGKFFSDMKVNESKTHPEAADGDLASQLWEVTEKAVTEKETEAGLQ